MKRPLVFGGILLALVLVWIGKHFLFPRYEPCVACDGGGALACGASGCEKGRVTCNGPCLRKDDPAWQHANVPNYPPDLLWKGFYNGDGSVQWISQNHLGDAVENVNGTWKLTGPCRQCNGMTRMPCPACRAKIPCPKCDGKGQINAWF